MSNTRQNEQVPADVIHLFKSIEEINEDFYHHREKKDDSVKGLALIKQILKAHPEYMFYKLDKIRLTGTWVYCDQISPFEYALLQGSHETWKHMLDCLQEYPNKAEISKKLLGVFQTLQKRNIKAIDLDETFLLRLNKLSEYAKLSESNQLQNFGTLVDDLYAPLNTKAVELTLRSRKNDQFRKDHPSPALFANPIQWLTGGESFDNFYQQWCAGVEQSIDKVKNESAPRLGK